MEKLTWKNEKRKIKDLIPADYNPRKMSDKEKRDLVESIDEFDSVDPLIVNTGTRENVLIGGHQRMSIYKEQGRDEVDVRVPSRELTLEEEKKLNLRLNKNVGSWDVDKLMQMDIEMLLRTGFGDEELSEMMDNVETFDDDFRLGKAIEEAKKTTVIAGDIYELGEHRLMCGDSTNPQDFEKLMGGVKADMVYSDPPYNIGLSYAGGIGTQNKYQGTYKDKKKESEYRDFILKTMMVAKEHVKDNAHFFYWCDEKYIWLMQILYMELGINNKRVCLWVKNNQNPTPQIAFNKVYEPCVYGVLGRPFLNRNYRAFTEVINKEAESGNQLIDDLLDLFNLWMVKRDDTQDYEHPTQKPITLHEKPIKRCTGPGHVIIDSFGGSGSTLMACEQLKRKSYLMEMSPVFCQVIINRWEEYTGKKAKKL